MLKHKNILRQTLLFMDLVETKSFTTSAKKFGISATTAIRWLKELEGNFNHNLLNQSTRQVVPTKTGMEIYNKAKSIRSDILNLEERVINLFEESSHVIRIESSYIFSHYYLVDILAKFKQMYPQINFEIHESNRANGIDNVDFLIHESINSYHTENRMSVIKRKFIEAPLYLVASPVYLQQHGHPTKPSDLLNHHCLYASHLTPDGIWFFKDKQNSDLEKISLIHTTVADNINILRSMAIQDMGITLLPYYLIKQEIDTQNLIPLMADYDHGTYSISVYFHHDLQEKSYLHTFKDFLIEQGVKIASLRKSS